MMKNVLVPMVALTFALLSHALGASVADTPWEKGNIDTLRALEEGAIAQFMTPILGNVSGHADCFCVKAKDIGEFTWADLQRDGKLELVASLDVNGRAFFDALVIFWRDASGKITYQEIGGRGMDDLDAVIKDLNGDGTKELVIPTELVSHSTADTTTWPAAYRLEKGKYVKASSEFASFYDGEVLPELKHKIEDTRREIDRIATSESHLDVQYRQSLQGKLADLITERDKIQRLVGRDPTAGLEDARTWIRSNNPDLLQDAAVTFTDIGGHEDEARAAGEAYRAHTWGGR
jgi:hypothetical protein